jgi:hypothetical protein
VAKKGFQVTDAMRTEVQSLAARGVPHESIAAIIGCDAKTLRKHCRHELDRGMAEANSQVAGALFENAIRGNIAAQIFWAKTRMGWRESKEPENPTQGTPVTLASPVVLLPDNNRDPELAQELIETQERYLARKRKKPQGKSDDSLL